MSPFSRSIQPSYSAITASHALWCLSGSEARQKPCEHRLGGVAQIVAELELAKVLRKMLPTNVNMSAPDRSLDLRPEPFDGIGMMDTVYPLIRGMVDGAMVVTKPRNLGVGRKLVSADGRAALDVLKDVPLKGLALHVRNDARHDIAAALDHAEHDGLSRRTAPALPALASPADVRFVGFHMPVQRGIAVRLGHVLADLMAHAPGRLVGHAKLSLKLLGRNTVAGSREQIKRVEPLRKRRVRPLKGRALHGADLVAAPLTAIDGALAQAVKLAVDPATRAVQRLAVANLHKVIQAAIVVWEPLEKLVNRRCLGLGHIRVLLPIYMGRTVT